jgi:cupin 2 domain-containing protein
LNRPGLQAKGSLFAGLDLPDKGEVFTELLRRRNVGIERILSSDTPDPVVYDQEQDEWVLLLEGRATLEVAGATIDLMPGDHVFIPARTPHRVSATFPEPRCLWLAVHIYPEESS